MIQTDDGKDSRNEKKINQSCRITKVQIISRDSYAVFGFSFAKK